MRTPSSPPSRLFLVAILALLPSCAISTKAPPRPWYDVATPPRAQDSEDPQAMDDFVLMILVITGALLLAAAASGSGTFAD